MGMTLSPHTQRLDPPGGSLATRGYDPDTLLFSISVSLALCWLVCVCVGVCVGLCLCVRVQTSIFLSVVMLLKENIP